MTSKASSRAGFTLPEMLTVVSLGSLIVISALQVITTQTRLYTVESESSQLRGSLRAAASVVANAIFELSASEGDLIAAAPDSIRMRAAVAGGILCSWTSVSDSIWYGLPSVSGEFVANDSVFVYGVSDDSWSIGQLAAVDTGTAATSRIPACFYGDSTTSTAPATEAAVRITGITDTLTVGAPIRAFEHTTFALRERSNSGWLVRRIGSDSAQVLAGPLMLDSGLVLSYYDSAGDSTSNPANVDRVEIFLRGLSNEAISGGRGYLSDSLRVMVKVRN